MRAVILVPFRGDGGPREANWLAAHERWLSFGFPIVVADSPGRRFERGEARNRAARKAGAWEVALFADADIMLGNVEQAEAALMRAWRTGAYSVAYSTLYHLSAEGTERVRGGRQPQRDDAVEAIMFTWECCFAIRRDLFDTIGGFDTRFRGYGGQGIAFFYAAGTLGGRERINGPAFHLDHPLVDRSRERHFQRNLELVRTYQDAVDDPEAMRAVLATR